MNNKRIIVTGAAGFIGANLCMELFRKGEKIRVIGIDNMNDYYDVSIKEWRLAEVEKFAAESVGSTWTFHQCNIADKTKIDVIFAEYKPDIVINLAAQAGVRYSITNPDAYIESNLVGFYNILEACRHSYDAADEDAYQGVEHLVKYIGCQVQMNGENK